MKATIIRLPPLLVTTMLVATPALGADAPATSLRPTPALTAPPTPTPVLRSGHPRAPRRRRCAAQQPLRHGRQPGETMQNLAERRIADLHAAGCTSRPSRASSGNQFAQVMRDNAHEMDQIYQAARREARVDDGGGQHAVLCADRAAAGAGRAEAGSGLPDAVLLAVRPAEEGGR